MLKEGRTGGGRQRVAGGEQRVHLQHLGVGGHGRRAPLGVGLHSLHHPSTFAPVFAPVVRGLFLGDQAVMQRQMVSRGVLIQNDSGLRQDSPLALWHGEREVA
jgi:hypothetical protein